MSLPAKHHGAVPAKPINFKKAFARKREDRSFHHGNFPVPVTPSENNSPFGTDQSHPLGFPFDLPLGTPQWVPSFDIPWIDLDLEKYFGDDLFDDDPEIPPLIFFKAQGGNVFNYDTAMDTRRERVLAAIERAEDLDPENTVIIGRVYNNEGESVEIPLAGQEILLSRPPSRNHSVDDLFNDWFPNITEPTCESYHDPSVVYSEVEDAYLLVWEAKCKAIVNRPTAAGLDLVPEEGRLFPIDQLHERICDGEANDPAGCRLQKIEATFTVIQGIKLNAETLQPVGGNGTLGSVWLLGQLYAWHLPNGEGDAAELSNRTVWKWSSNLNPHLAIDGEGKVLLTYQSDIKGSKCFNFEQAREGNYHFFDAVSTIEGQLILSNDLFSGRSLFRSPGTAGDDGNQGRDEATCRGLQDREILNAYNPVTAPSPDGRGFLVLYTVEEGRLADLQDFVGTDKRLSRTSVELAADNTPRVADETDETILFQFPNQDMFVNGQAGSRDHLGNLVYEGDHSQADILFDELSAMYVTVVDDAEGSYVLFLDNDGEVIETTAERARVGEVLRGVNLNDTGHDDATLIESHEAGYEPRLTVYPSTLLIGGADPAEWSGSKVGVSFSLLSNDRWEIGQNYLLIQPNRDGVRTASLERRPDRSLILSQPEQAWSVHPIPEVFAGKDHAERFFTLWIGSPEQPDDPLFHSFVPEGYLPVPIIQIESGDRRVETDAGGNSLIATPRVNPGERLPISLDGTQSHDVDGGPNDGIQGWSWEIAATNPRMGFATVALEGSEAELDAGHGLPAFGTYEIRLTVIDHDNFTKTMVKRLIVEDACQSDPDHDIDNDGTCGNVDNCPQISNPDGGDRDGDGAGDACDACVDDRLKVNPGVCGCGVSDNDADRDGTFDCNDLCPIDPTKAVPGQCGCGQPDTDTDRDGTADCNDGCPENRNKLEPGICGCLVADTDGDRDGTPDCNDACPDDRLKIQPGPCGCGQADTDSDDDRLADCVDSCPRDSANDADGDSVCGDVDNCPVVSNNGQENDDRDLLGNACDICPQDATNDVDGDGFCENLDNCPGIANPDQGNADRDSFGNVCDECPNDPDNDVDRDGRCGNQDNCPFVANLDQDDDDHDDIGNACDRCPGDPINDPDGDGICHRVDNCPAVANADQEDSDEDGQGNRCDLCPNDATNDADRDGVCQDVDTCPDEANPDQADRDSDGLGDACDEFDTFVRIDGYAVGSNVFAIDTALLNNDEFVDIVVSASSPDLIGVFLGNADATFQEMVPYPVGTGPFGFDVVDVDEDGIADVVVANHDGTTISVLLGRGDGSFEPQTEMVTTGSRPNDLVSTDFNGDLHMDLAVINFASNNVVILLGDGLGGFATGETYATGGGPHVIETADLNGDDNNDLAIANYNSDTFSILLGNGNGTFQNAVSYDTGRNPWSLKLADIDSDGNPDVLLTNNSDDEVAVFSGSGLGTFALSQNYAVGIRPANFALGDIGGDGDLDVVVANYGSDEISILFGNGNGTFQNGIQFPAGTNPIAIELTDVDGNGILDVIVGNHTSQDLDIFIH